MEESEIVKVLHVGKTADGQDMDVIITKDGSFQVRIGGKIMSVRFPAAELDQVIEELCKSEK